MKKFRKSFQQRFISASSSVAIGAALFGLTTNTNSVKASSPALCKDKLTQTTLKQNIFSENNTQAATALSGFNYYCLGSPDKFEMVIYEMGLCTQNPISGKILSLEITGMCQ